MFILRTPDIVSPDFDTFSEIEFVRVPERSASSFNDAAISAKVLSAPGAAPTTNSIAS